ncbi:MAG: DUF4242 domain-containing protein [Xanthomonadales bacterium]|nr:DUF4242 domain-containing protein [Xanthomonadales bacterium]
MALFLVERNFDEQVDFTDEGFRQINDVTDELGADWLFTFLSADKKKAYCLYEARDTEHLREHAKVVGLPADSILEVSKAWPLPD